jgi:hypothetical protein
MAYTEASMIVGTIPTWHAGVSPRHVLLMMDNGRPHLSLETVYGEPGIPRVWIAYPGHEAKMAMIMLHAHAFRTERVRTRLSELVGRSLDDEQDNPIEITETVTTGNVSELFDLCAESEVEAGILLAEVEGCARGREIREVVSRLPGIQIL